MTRKGLRARARWRLLRRGMARLVERRPDKGKVLTQVREGRNKLALFLLTTVVSILIGFWLDNLWKCLPAAQSQAELANELTGNPGHDEHCFFLAAKDGDQSGFRVAQKAIEQAQEALDQCHLRCFFGDCCEPVKREIALARANLALLEGDCRASLGHLEPLRKAGALSEEEVVTWAWAKVESDPSEASYREAIHDLQANAERDSCVATTEGSLLRRLASFGSADRNGLLAAALAAHERAVALKPTSFLADYNRAAVLLDLKRIDEALEASDAAADHLNGGSDPYLHTLRAQLFELRHEPQKALDELSAAVETGSLDPELRLARGWTLLRMGKFPEAESDFQGAKRILGKGEISCRRSAGQDGLAEALWGLSLARYKAGGAIPATMEMLREALGKAEEPDLKESIAADLEKLGRRLAEAEKGAGKRGSGKP